LFQVVFHARMAEEGGRFRFADIVAGLCDKMVRRHPHVFADAEIVSAAAQTQSWEAMKAEERAAKAAPETAPSALDGVARALPALSRAVKLQKRAARAGFDWPTTAPVFDKLDEELAELRAEIQAGAARERLAEELGDVMFVCANLCRHLGVDAEAALGKSNAKFERRFRRIEALLAASGRTPEQSGLAEMDRLWDQAKSEESA
jgi:MazG family protein